MLYAKVVVSLPVDGPFDYLVPQRLAKQIRVGSRVWVDFCFKRSVGFCVGLSHKSQIKKLKEVGEIIDFSEIVSKELLSFTRKLSQYYCCSWGEAIAAALPLALRKGKRIEEVVPAGSSADPKKKPEIVLLQSLSRQNRWRFYLEQLQGTLKQKQSAILLFSDIQAALSAKQFFAQGGLASGVTIFYRNQPKEIELWGKIRANLFNVVLGTRSAIFAPLTRPGLIIIDEESNSVYKQEQTPHYHAREAAIIRSGIEGAKLILGGASPSLESFYLYRSGKARLIVIEEKQGLAQVQVVNKKFDFLMPRLIEDAILASLAEKKKVLVFINRKGFATFASCNSCGLVIKCPRCDLALTYYFTDGLLKCNHCNFSSSAPKICPNCNSGYIKYSGFGSQKVESELARIFPQAKVGAFPESDIFVATSSVLKQDQRFSLSAVLAIDNQLNQPDFRATEKTFILLRSLQGITQERMIIESNFSKGLIFQALTKNDSDGFLGPELKQRRLLGLPPFKHLVLIKLRAKALERAKNKTAFLFEELKKANPAPGIEIVSSFPGAPGKLRGYYYWEILLKGKNLLKLNQFLKINLKNFRHSGIIVTIDVDPI